MKTTIALPALLCTLLLASPAFAQGMGTNYETRLQTLEDEMRALNGRVEQVEFAAKRLDQAIQRMQGDYDARLTRLEQQAAQAQAAPAPQAQTAPPPAASSVPVADPTGTLGSLKTQNGRVTGGSVAPQATPLPDTPADYGLTPQEQYEQAFDILRKADYAGAEKAFKGFIDKNPKDKLVENAKYWYGETLYVQSKFNDASVAFADAYQQNPQGAKAPDCLLKLALSLSAMNKTPDACTALGQLKSKYPAAPVNIKSRATEERAKLKCS
ncbi:MAG TPA: tol-pal system protein YbgF [Alphaproteobacteria bacterium]|nr:tol-pal system protein YbgF [Alphaproteobacteria bacterium]